jgi:E3 ubiquitin-protein ligase SHPRH
VPDPSWRPIASPQVCCDGCNAWLHGGCLGFKRAPRGSYECSRCSRARAAEQVGPSCRPSCCAPCRPAPPSPWLQLTLSWRSTAGATPPPSPPTHPLTHAQVVSDCGTTLVVVPTPIRQQWRDEILRHLRPGALKLLEYHGQPQPGTSRPAGCAGLGDGRVVTAAELAAADIVLTTYDVLRADLCHQPQLEQQERALRRPKRYQVRALAGWLPGRLAAWLPRRLAARLPGCLAAWLPGCLAAWLPGCSRGGVPPR